MPYITSEEASKMAYEQGVRVGRAAERERCAKIADSFRCGLCGMDGKVSAAIRKGE